MKQAMIRYRTKPESADENARLINGVFAELAAKSPQGIRYLALNLGNGSFAHLFIADDNAPAITEFEAFRTFQSGIRERCLEPPKPSDVTIVGNYRMLDD